MPRPFRKSSRGAILDGEWKAIVVQLLESQGYRELAAAQVFGASLRFAPSLDDKMLLADQLREELEHFEAVAALYEDVRAGDLLSAVEKRAADVPVPGSWLEVAVCQFLFDRAGKFQIQEYRSSSYAPYAEIVRKILADEESHGAAGEAALRDLCQADHPDPASRALAQEHFERWLRTSLLSFGRPGTPNDQRAVELGLKARPAADVIRDYLRDLQPAMEACGLSFPSRERLGLDLPDDAPIRGAEEAS